MNKDELIKTLEALVDKYGPRLVCEELVEVFWYQAEHVATSWQDAPLAQSWSHMAAHLGHAVHWEITWPGE